MQVPGRPLFVPTAFEGHDQFEFRVGACVCSWACAERFILETEHANSSRYVKQAYLLSLYRVVERRCVPQIWPAPRFDERVAYGGKLTDTEFRTRVADADLRTASAGKLARPQGPPRTVSAPTEPLPTRRTAVAPVPMPVSALQAVTRALTATQPVDTTSMEPIDLSDIGLW